MNKEERDKLITDNMQLVYYLINKYYPKWLHDEDVQQEGMVGLVKAADTFDESKSKFATYAGKCILNQIRLYFRSEMKQSVTFSLDTPIPGENVENLTLQDIIVGDVDITTLPTDLKLFYEVLDEREQKILELSLMFNEYEIADIVGLDQSYVSRLKTKIRRKWRKFNGEDTD